MKKTKILVIAACAVSVLNFAGCKKTTGNDEKNDTPETKKSTSADFRNKDSGGNIFGGRFAGRAADDELLEQTFVKVTKNPQNLTDEELDGMITFYDSAAGMKVVFTAPDRLKDANLGYLQMDYIDGTEKWSTQLTLDDAIRNENGKVKPKFEFEYPLVIAGKESQFVFQGSFSSGHEFVFFEKVTPKHGKGRVDDLPEDIYDRPENEAYKYAEFKDGVMKLSNVVPPEATSVKKSVLVQCEKNKDSWWAEGGKQIASITKDIEYGHVTDFFLGDIKTVNYSGEALNLSDTPYCHVVMSYKYTIKNFDGLTFSTPNIESNMMDVDFFKTPVANRSVSKTTAEGNKITFSGNGYFDGLYEGDIKVTVGGESYIPAIFVKGLNVYILAVNNGTYTLKKVKAISEFLDEGGSFANVEGSTVYAKLKTDTSEANLDKSETAEITIIGDLDYNGEKNVKVEDVKASLVLKAAHPIEDGVEDTSVTNCYQQVIEITDLYNGSIPKTGDVIHLSWKGKSDSDISKLKVFAVENTAAASWWNVVSEDYFINDIEADTPFNESLDIVLTKDCIEGIHLCFQAATDVISAPATIVKVSE